MTYLLLGGIGTGILLSANDMSEKACGAAMLLVIGFCVSIMIPLLITRATGFRLTSLRKEPKAKKQKIRWNTMHRKRPNKFTHWMPIDRETEANSLDCSDLSRIRSRSICDPITLATFRILADRKKLLTAKAQKSPDNH